MQMVANPIITRIQIENNDVVSFLNGTDYVRSMSQILPQSPTYISYRYDSITISQVAGDAFTFTVYTIDQVGGNSFTPLNFQDTAATVQARTVEIYRLLVTSIFKGCCECGSTEPECSIQYTYGLSGLTGQFDYTAGFPGQIRFNNITGNNQDFSGFFPLIPDGSWVFIFSKTDPTTYAVIQLSNFLSAGTTSTFDATELNANGTPFVEGTQFCIDFTSVGGSLVQGWQDTLDISPILDKDNTVDGGGFDFVFDNNSSFTINSPGGSIEADGTGSSLNAGSQQILVTAGYIDINTPAIGSASTGWALTLTAAGHVEYAQVGSVTSIATAGLISGGTITSSGTITTSMNTDRLVGRYSPGTGIMQEITIGAGLTLSALGELSADGTVPVYTVANGLHYQESPFDDHVFHLGGSLIEDTTIDDSGYDFTITQNQANSALFVENTYTGPTGGEGIHVTSNNERAGYFSSGYDGTLNDEVQQVILVERTTSLPPDSEYHYNEIGSAIDFRNPFEVGPFTPYPNIPFTSRIASRWTNSYAAGGFSPSYVVGRTEMWNWEGSIPRLVATFNSIYPGQQTGRGLVQFNNYGTGTFYSPSDATYALGVDILGNIIEIDLGGGGGGGTVTSVDLSMPPAFTVTNNPVTTSGTLTVTGAGLSSQYIDGTGALQFFPAIPVDQGLQDVITYNNNLTTNNTILGNSTTLNWNNNSVFEIKPETTGYFRAIVGKYPPSESELYVEAIYAQMRSKGATEQIVKVDTIGVYIQTPAVDSGTATNGQVLALTDATTGKVEFQTVGGSSPLTTKGDLYTYSTTNDRLPVGTNGQVLVADNTTATGLKWDTISSGGGIPFGTATAAVTDVYTATIGTATSYVDGDAYLVRFTVGNTDAATLNINGIGARTLYRNNDGPLIGGDIFDGGEMLCVYNAVNNGFDCIGSSPNTLFAYVTNDQGSTITRGQAVYAAGGTGNRMTVKLAKADTDATSAQTIGFVFSTSIGINQKGIIIIQGYFTDLNLFPPSAGWLDGDTVYLSPTTAGAVTRTKPLAPEHLVYLGVVATTSPGSAGRMYVRVQNGYEMNELHDVASTGAVNNDILYRDTTVTPNLWKPASIPTILGYTPVTNARTISTTSPLSGGGDLTADRTLSIANAVADGTTKGAATFTASDFNDNGSGVISIDYTNGQKATASQPGFLTAADWSTFNSKASGDSTVFSSNQNTSQGAGTTTYWAIIGGATPTNEAERQIIMPCAGTLKSFYVRNRTAQSTGGSLVFTVRKNGADTAITVTFVNADGAATTKSDTTNTVSVAAGDLINVKGVNNAAGSASAVIVGMSLILERT